jgi:hypothetical protein
VDARAALFQIVSQQMENKRHFRRVALSFHAMQFMLEIPM